MAETTRAGLQQDSLGIERYVSEEREQILVAVLILVRGWSSKFTFLWKPVD